MTRPAPRCSAIRAAHLPDRAEPEDGQRAALGHVRVLDRLPRRREDVGEVDEAVVGRALGHLDRAELRLRAPAATRPGRPAPGRRAWCSRTAPRPCPARAPASSRTATAGSESHMQQCPHEMLNGTTTRSPGAMPVTSAPTSSTMPIGSCPRMSPASRNGAEHLVEVQVGAADAARGDRARSRRSAPRSSGRERCRPARRACRGKRRAFMRDRSGWSDESSSWRRYAQPRG